MFKLFVSTCISCLYIYIYIYCRSPRVTCQKTVMIPINNPIVAIIRNPSRKNLAWKGLDGTLNLNSMKRILRTTEFESILFYSSSFTTFLFTKKTEERPQHPPVIIWYDKNFYTTMNLGYVLRFEYPVQAGPEVAMIPRDVVNYTGYT
jgi:hypothetical protein